MVKRVFWANVISVPKILAKTHRIGQTCPRNLVQAHTRYLQPWLLLKSVWFGIILVSKGTTGLA